MQKEDIKALLFPYVNGELTADENQVIEARCLADADLARELELTRATMRLLAQRQPAAIKPFFWTRLSARLEAEEARRFAWIWAAKRLIPAMVAATLIVAVFLSSRTDLAYDRPDDDGSTMLAYEADEGYNQNVQEMTDDSILESVFFPRESRAE